MSESSPYPSAQNEDCFEPGAGLAQVANRCPDGRLMDQPNDIDLSKAEPSLIAMSWMSMVGSSWSDSSGRLEEMMSIIS